MITNFHTEPPEQGAYGRYPEAYLIELPFRSMDSIQKLPGSGREKLNRDAVRKISQDAKIEPLIVYACIMAWGGRDFGNFRRSLQETNAKQVARLIEHLRGSKRPRAEDFEFTQKAANGISGLGISFYTKLLFSARKTRCLHTRPMDRQECHGAISRAKNPPHGGRASISENVLCNLRGFLHQAGGMLRGGRMGRGLENRRRCGADHFRPPKREVAHMAQGPFGGGYTLEKQIKFGGEARSGY